MWTIRTQWTFWRMFTISKRVLCVFWRMFTIRTNYTLRILEDVYNRCAVYILEDVYNPYKRTLCAPEDVYKPYPVYTAYFWWYVHSAGCVQSVKAYAVCSGGCVQTVHGWHCMCWRMCTIGTQCTFRRMCTIRKSVRFVYLKDVHNPYIVYIVYSGRGCELSVQAYSVYSGECLQKVHSVHCVFWRLCRNVHSV